MKTFAEFYVQWKLKQERKKKKAGIHKCVFKPIGEVATIRIMKVKIKRKVLYTTYACSLCGETKSV